MIPYFLTVAAGPVRVTEKLELVPFLERESAEVWAITVPPLVVMSIGSFHQLEMGPLVPLSVACAFVKPQLYISPDAGATKPRPKVRGPSAGAAGQP